MDEFYCDGLDLVETQYEGKTFVNYFVYGHKDGSCKFYGVPYVIYKISYSKESDLLHGHRPEELKGRFGRVFYDKYRNPSYFDWDFNEL